MHVIADICVVPFTGRVSVRAEVARAHAILKEAGLATRLHAYGTNVEGEYDVVFAALKRVHETLHAEGAARISTTIRLGSRTDKAQGMAEKVRVVEELLERDGKAE